MPSPKICLFLAFTLCASGCFNDNEERRVVLGDVSLGDQLIDLKKAHEAEAISDKEYQQLRKGLITMITEQQASDRDDDDDDEVAEEIDGEDEEEGFSWL